MALACTALLAGCQVPVRHADWEHYDGPGAEVLRLEQAPPPDFPDPIEPWNRSVSVLNHGLVIGVIDPLATVYRFVVPSPVRTSIQHFSINLLYPRRLLAYLFQAEVRGAWDETRRFGVNTTLGLLGFFDPATRFSIPQSDQDFGQVFGKWGWAPSTYFVLPFFGPSTLRDAVGLVPDSLTNPTFYVPYSLFIGGGLVFNEQADLVVPYKRFVRSTFDPYHLGRMLWTLDREERFFYRPRPSDTAAVQTLQVAFLSPRDPGFADEMSQRKVRAAGGGRLPYSYRLQPGAAPIIYLIPGLGAHRLDGSSLALAEMAYDRGFSVAILSSAMNWEFIETGASVPMPGYTPADVQDVHFALDAMHRDLDARHPGRLGRRALMGYSLGAFHALFIAAAERAGSPLVGFDRYVTVDAPIQLLTGMRKIDAFYNGLLALPPAEREMRVRELLWRTMAIAESEEGRRIDYSRWTLAEQRRGRLRPRGALPFSDFEAKYLVGLDFRLSLVDILGTLRDREDLGVLQTERSFLHRESSYVEMAGYSYEAYLYAFVLPCFSERLQRVSGMDELIAQSDLRAVEDGLRGNPKIRHFANDNDFLAAPPDLDWLTATLGAEHVTVYPTGGHLGNLSKPEVQAEIMDSIEDLLHSGDAGALP
jgi:ABC-type transporter lipoprotein component MlaA